MDIIKIFWKRKNDILYVYGKGIYNNNNITVRAALTAPDARNFEREKEEESGFCALLNAQAIVTTVVSNVKFLEKEKNDIYMFMKKE